MEKINEQIMPKIDLFPVAAKIGRFVQRLVHRFPDGAPNYMSDHYTGAAAMLDEHLYDHPQLPFDITQD